MIYSTVGYFAIASLCVLEFSYYARRTKRYFSTDRNNQNVISAKKIGHESSDFGGAILPGHCGMREKVSSGLEF